LTGNVIGNASTATSATTATTAATATTANNFSGSLAGDVAGTQGATVVSSVGGQTAAAVASGASAANAATDANTTGAIVKRDASGNFSAGTITANLAGNATTATTVTGNIADTQLSDNIPRLNQTNIFTAPVIAMNANNVVNGTISGDGSGLTNLPSTLNYVFSYDTNIQSVASANTFQDVTFNTDAQINGWKHTAGSAGFTNGPGGLYMVEYEAETSIANSSSTTVSVRAVLNGAEIAGSQAATSPASSGSALPVSKSFIIRIPTANTNVFKLQFTGSSVNNRLISNIGQGTTKPSVSVTIVRIQ
jgi:hypothetical protein